MNNDSKVLQWLSESDTFPAQEQHEEQPRKSYDKKIVGWLDILGIRAKIKDEKNNDAESIISIMSEMASYVSSSCDKFVAEGTISIALKNLLCRPSPPPQPLKIPEIC